MPADPAREPWPHLPAADWARTRAALHRRLQIVGKIRLSADPGLNHCWGSTLSLTPVGFTTGPMHFGDRCAEVVVDLLHDQLAFAGDDGSRDYVDLEPRPVREFYEAVAAAMTTLGLPFEIWPMPQELGPWDDLRPDGLLSTDAGHADYDGEHAWTFHRLLLSADRVLNRFRAEYLGKCSPSHLFWGSFDLACTRFDGEPAPPHPGGIPGLSDRVTREAYSHRCISAGFWAGDGADDAPGEPAFYSYAHPAPDGFGTAAENLPDSAYWMRSGGEYVLPVSAVRAAADPGAAAVRFLRGVYEAAADGLSWDRAALDRRPPARN